MKNNTLLLVHTCKRYCLQNYHPHMAAKKSNCWMEMANNMSCASKDQM